MKLRDKVALVTGSSSGIGAAIAQGMAAAGADIIINYRHNEAGAQRTAQAVRTSGRKALVVRADVGLAEDVARLFEEIKCEYGRLDILVNNAGITPKKPFAATTEEDWDRIIDTNLKSIFLCCKQALSLIPPGGVILNISSIHARVTTYNFSVYAASKAGVEALTCNLAVEFSDRNIRVNALRPGWIVVEREPFDVDDPTYEDVCARIPLHRPGQVEDLVPSAIHLCCDDASFITGQMLGIDGGAAVMMNSPFPKGFVEGGAWEE